MEMEIVAWVAAGLVFLSFFMKNKVLPILVLHIALLPLNVMRLRQVRNTIRSNQAMTREHASLDALIPYMKHESIKRGNRYSGKETWRTGYSF